jgi:hypothetical protein
MSIKINMFLSNFSFFKNPSVEGGWGRGCVSSKLSSELTMVIELHEGGVLRSMKQKINHASINHSCNVKVNVVNESNRLSHFAISVMRISFPLKCIKSKQFM